MSIELPGDEARFREQVLVAIDDAYAQANTYLGQEGRGGGREAATQIRRRFVRILEERDQRWARRALIRAAFAERLGEIGVELDDGIRELLVDGLMPLVLDIAEGRWDQTADLSGD